MKTSRRQFLWQSACLPLASQSALATASSLVAAEANAQSAIQVGYHVSTWGENLEQALTDLAALGFRGVQLDGNAYRKFADRPAACKELLAAKNLTLISLSADGLTIRKETEKQEIAERVALAKWVKEVGGQYLQVADAARAERGANASDDYQKLGKRLSEIGKRTLNEYGIKLGYHNQMDSLGERGDEVSRILDAADAKYVWAVPDVAQMFVAGGDPVKFVRDYVLRMAYPHFKDALLQPVSASLDGTRPRPKYSFVELGQGKINLSGALQIMKDFRYQGWLILELERTLAGRTPKESAQISKQYLTDRLRLTL